jgi:HSP20 family molecular chaperone IbpA/CBS domain-containing protein
MASKFGELALSAGHSTHGPFLGPVDIFETGQAIIFSVDAPGLTKSDVKVQLNEGFLRISGERLKSATSSSGTCHRSERTFGCFSRCFHLPENLDVHGVKATCDHGVLTVTVPKKNADVSTLVNVTSHDEQGDGSLNADFANVPISIFPTPALGKLIVIDSDMSLLEAVKVLSKHHILAAPVRDVTKPSDASWSEKYLGILDMVGVVLHMLQTLLPEGKSLEDFEKEMETVEAFKKTTVGNAIASLTRFGQFVPVEHDTGSLLDCMLLCGLHAIRRVPVVKTPGGDLTNIVTQSALVQTLAANLKRFEAVGSKTLTELGLGTASRIITVTTEDPLKKAFDLIRDMDVSAVPVVDPATQKIKGNISARDVRLIVSSTKVYKLLNMPIRVYLDVVAGDSSENSAITCRPTDTMATVITRMVQSKIHRIYLVDGDEHLVRVISLRDVLTKFVKEPEGYFGRYFG